METPFQNTKVQSRLLRGVTLRLKAVDMAAYNELLRALSTVVTEEQGIIERLRRADSDLTAVLANPSSNFGDRHGVTSECDKARRELDCFETLEAAPILIRWGLIGFDGLTIDGHKATPKDLLEGNCPDGLWSEVVTAIRSIVQLFKDLVSAQSSAKVN